MRVERKELASLLRSAREAHGWTQKELADKIYISHSQISNYENGASFPNEKTASLLSDALGVDLSGAVKRAVDKKETNRRKAIKVEITIGEDLVGTPMVGELLQVLRKYEMV